VRSRNIGTALASALVASARQRGFLLVEAYVLPENAAARALVAGRGFRSVGSCSGYLRFTLEVWGSQPDVESLGQQQAEFVRGERRPGSRS
jgi:ribosomal protein S18 acetylase RimI-like enzyme